MGLSQLPGDIGETIRLPGKANKLEAILLVVYINQWHLAVIKERQENFTCFKVGPFLIHDATVIAKKVFNHDIASQEGIGGLP